jgi:hypothetical protein
MSYMSAGTVEGPMPETVKMTLPGGKIVDGIPIGIRRSIEQWCEFELDDGAKFKGKLSVSAVMRATNEYDPNGIPFYQLQVIPVVTPIEVPDELKEKKER